MIRDKNILAFEPVVHSLACDSERVRDLCYGEIQIDCPTPKLIAGRFLCSHDCVNYSL